MGTPDIAKEYLDSLIKNNFNIIATYTQPPRKKGRGMRIQNSPVYEFSLANNIPIYTPINFTAEKTIEEFKALKSDLAIVMGYGQLLPTDIINTPTHGSINIHVSLLPRWRGASPIEHAIMNGDTKTGISIIKLEKRLDAGPIISKKIISIDKDITKGELIKELNTLGTKLLIETLPKFFDNKLFLEKQNESYITYAKKINSENRKINFNDDIEKVYNHIRAFSPNPSAWFFYKKERINIIKCSMEICDSQSSLVINDFFHIGCKNGKIIPQILQREGKKSLEIKEFLKGFNFEVNHPVNE